VESALVKLGVDPRVDSECRQYQTLNFKIVIKDGTNAWSDGRVKYLRSLKGKQETVDKTSHLFNGLKVVADGKVWQICDITDPLLREIIDSDPPVETCDVSSDSCDTVHCMERMLTGQQFKADGWFYNVQLAKVHVIMRDKIMLLMSGITPVDIDYGLLSKMPNFIDEKNAHLAVFSKNEASIKEIELAMHIRSMAKHRKDPAKFQEDEKELNPEVLERDEQADADEIDADDATDENGMDDDDDDDDGNTMVMED